MQSIRGEGHLGRLLGPETRGAVAALSPNEKNVVSVRSRCPSADVADRIVAVDIATGSEHVIRTLAGEVATLPRIPAGIDLALSRDGRMFAFLVCNLLSSAPTSLAWAWRSEMEATVSSTV